MTVSSETRPVGAALPQFLGTDMNDIHRWHRPIEQREWRISVQSGQ
jgi:hypothetical protein